ncbi:MAG: hypothetical protein ACRD8Z_09215 [Nitrososphaeraceae archaeon]
MTTINLKPMYASIFLISLVLLSGIPLISGSISTNIAKAKYANTNTQTQAVDNDCTGPNANCAVNSPQTQGDGSASTPMNTQVSKFEEKVEIQEIPGGAGVPTIIVQRNVVCPEGFQCPTVSQFFIDINTVPEALIDGEIIPMGPFASETRLFLIGATEFQYSIRIDSSLFPPIPPGLSLTIDRLNCSGTVDTIVAQECRLVMRFTPQQPAQ